MIINNTKFLYFLFTFCFIHLQVVIGSGLRFYGRGYPIDERTSYDVFREHPVTFSGSLEMTFDLSLYSTSHIGNIVRIKTDNNSPIFNLFYNGHGEKQLFLLNEEGKNNLINISLDKSNYSPRQWLTVHLRFDLKNKTIDLTVGEQTFKVDNVTIPEKFAPTIVFGRSDHIIDVPSFVIKNLSVGNGRKYRFLLNESHGNTVHDIHGRKIGYVANPDWLINDSYHWKSEVQFSSSTVAGTNFHQGRQELYYLNRDSLIIFNLRTKNSHTVLFSSSCPVNLSVGTTFIDQKNHRLYCYEIFEGGQNPTIASLDLDSFEWRIESYEHLSFQLHHHASYFDVLSRQYILFGGFGNRRFSNQFYSYNLENSEWGGYPVNNKGGITPRYFASMGYNEHNHSLYIFGGTGNVSGDQLLGRDYFYDLFQLDLYSNELTKVWEIPWQQVNVVPVRGMIIDDDNSFYTLCYPEHYTESFLKLYRFSLDEAVYTILGDSIPIHSDKIKTNANLYFDRELKTLYAVVHQFEDDIKSELHVYSLAFPPITASELAEHPPTGKSNIKILLYFIVGLVIFLLAGTVLYILRRRGKFKIKNLDDGVPESHLQMKSFYKRGNTPLTIQKKFKDRQGISSVYLFGEFTVHTHENRDITYMFSKKLKETFCLLLQFSQEGGGITSRHLSRELWPEKPLREVKNTRNVTFNRLRKILEELDGLELLYENGIFTLKLDESIYCDYTRCMQISSNLSDSENAELFEIVTRGKFLENEDSPFYDTMKHETEKRIEPIILRSMEENEAKGEYRMAIDLAETIFYIDPMNEAAITCLITSMQKLGMNKEAKIRYLSYLIEYKKIMGKEHPKPMNL